MGPNRQRPGMRFVEHFDLAVEEGPHQLDAHACRRRVLDHRDAFEVFPVAQIGLELLGVAPWKPSSSINQRFSPLSSGFSRRGTMAAYCGAASNAHRSDAHRTSVLPTSTPAAK